MILENGKLKIRLDDTTVFTSCGHEPTFSADHPCIFSSGGMREGAERTVSSTCTRSTITPIIHFTEHNQKWKINAAKNYYLYICYMKDKEQHEQKRIDSETRKQERLKAFALAKRAKPDSAHKQMDTQTDSGWTKGHASNTAGIQGMCSQPHLPLRQALPSNFCLISHTLSSLGDSKNSRKERQLYSGKEEFSWIKSTDIIMRHA